MEGAVEVGQAVREHAAFVVDLQGVEFQSVLSDGKGVAEVVLVLHGAVFAVVVTEQLDGVPRLDGDEPLVLDIDVVDLLRAEDGVVTGLLVEFHDDVDAFPVEFRRDELRGDILAVAVLVEVGDRVHRREMAVQSDPVAGPLVDEVALVGELRGVVETEVEPAAVVLVRDEDVDFGRFDLGPLFVGQGQDVLAVLDDRREVGRVRQGAGGQLAGRFTDHGVRHPGGSSAEQGREVGAAVILAAGGRIAGVAGLRLAEHVVKVIDGVAAVVLDIRAAGAAVLTVLAVGVAGRVVVVVLTAGQEVEQRRAGAVGRDLSGRLHRRVLTDGARERLIHLDLIVDLRHGVHVPKVAVREVQGKAVGVRDAFGTVVLDRVLDLFCQRFRLGAVELQAKVDEVDLVEAIRRGELFRRAPGIRDVHVMVRGQGRLEVVAELRQGGRDRPFQFREVDHGEGRHGAVPVVVHLTLRLRGEVVEDPLAELQGRSGCIGIEVGQPVGVVPAGAGLRFFGGDEVVGVGLDRDRVLERGHQAGVEPDEVEFHAAVFERFGHFVGGHRVVRVEFIAAVTGNTAAAMVPKNEHVAVCRSLLLRELDERGERLRFGHGSAPQRLEALQAAGRGAPPLDVPGAHDIVLPAPGTAGLDDDVQVLVVEVGMEDLIEVHRGHTGLRLEVGADDVEHQRDFVLAVALEGRELGPGRAVHVLVHHGLIRIGHSRAVAVGRVVRLDVAAGASAEPGKASDDAEDDG